MREIRPVLLVGTLAFASFFTLLSLAPALAAQSGGSSAAGMVTGVFMAVTVITQLGTPRLIRKVRPRPLIATSLLLLGVPSLIYLYALPLPLALIVASLRGIGFGIVTIVTTALVSALATPTSRGTALGVYGFTSSVAGAFLPSLGIWSLEAGWLTIPVVIGFAVPLAGLPALGLVTSEWPPGMQGTQPSWSRLWRVDVAAPILIFLPSAIVYGGLFTFLSLSSALPALALLLFGTGFALGRLGGGWLTDRVAPRMIMVPAAAASFVGILLTALGSGVLGSTAFPLLAGCGVGTVTTISLTWVMNSLGPGGESLGSASWNAAFDLGIAIGGFVLGATAARLGFEWAYGVAAFLVGMAVILSIGSLKLRSGESPRGSGQGSFRAERP